MDDDLEVCALLASDSSERRAETGSQTEARRILLREMNEPSGGFEAGGKPVPVGTGRKGGKPSSRDA